MKAIVFNDTRNHGIGDSFAEGLVKHGYDVDRRLTCRHIPDLDQYDLVVTTNWSEKQRNIVKQAKPVLCISDGYTHGYAVSMDFVGAYGRHLKKYDDSRLTESETLWCQLPGDTDVIVYQHTPDVFGDSREAYFMDTALQHSEAQIIYHPRDPNRKNKLKLDNINIRQAFTYDSNASVYLRLNGIECEIAKTSMASYHINDDGEWVKWLSYQQWSKEEFISGKCFEHYKEEL